MELTFALENALMSHKTQLELAAEFESFCRRRALDNENEIGHLLGLPDMRHRTLVSLSLALSVGATKTK